MLQNIAGKSDVTAHSGQKNWVKPELTELHDTVADVHADMGITTDGFMLSDS